MPTSYIVFNPTVHVCCVTRRLLEKIWDATEAGTGTGGLRAERPGCFGIRIAMVMCSLYLFRS